jgi:hypothetical protein
MSPTLLLTWRFTEDAQALWRAAGRRGWRVERVRGVTPPDDLEGEVVLYAEGLFAPTVADQLGVELASPAGEWLPSLPSNLRRREVTLMTLRHARELTRPTFIKPATTKAWTAKVYADPSADLPEADEAEPVLTAEPVVWAREFRCFCLGGRVMTVSPYLRHGELARNEDGDWPAAEDELRQAEETATAALDCGGLPDAIVVDVGEITGRGWTVVEANAAWGSGLYGCDPEAVLDVVRAASRHR